MKKKPVIIVAVAIVSLILIIIGINIITDDKSNNQLTEDTQTELINTTESITEDTELELNEYGYSNKVIPEGAQVEKLDDGRLRVTLENGIIYQVNKAGTTSMTVAQRREAKKIDPQYMEHIDCDADGMTYDDYKERQANGTLTFEDMVNLDSSEMSEEEYERRIEDNVLWGERVINEDGTSYIKMDNGEILNPGEEMPGGGIYGGTAADRANK